MSNYQEEHDIQESSTSEQTSPQGEGYTPLTRLLQDLFESTDASVDPSMEMSTDQMRMVALALAQSPLARDLFQQSGTEGQIKGMPQEFIDSLERVPKTKLKLDQTCPICTNDFVDDPHPLVVELPCDGRHRFDMECIAPWLKVQSTCPVCRKNLHDKKTFDLPEDDEEEEEGWEMYG